MPNPRFLAGVACALLVACGSEPRAPKLPDGFAVFPNLPLPPEAQVVSRAGSADALQITLFTPTESGQVIEYYRNVLGGGTWRLVSDVKRPDGSIALYAEQDGPPLWVRIWPTSDKAGTMVELAGALLAKAADPVKVDRSGSKPSPKPK